MLLLHQMGLFTIFLKSAFAKNDQIKSRRNLLRACGVNSAKIMCVSACPVQAENNYLQFVSGAIRGLAANLQREYSFVMKYLQTGGHAAKSELRIRARAAVEAHTRLLISNYW